jgi:dihydroorotate dehydrogenase electron transfer subunit
MYVTANVVENRALGRGNYVLRLAGCSSLAEAQPGQFVMVRGEWGRDPLLPRAFSILRTLPDGGCEILAKAVGRGTRLLEHVAVGAPLSVLGPLVAGGVGLAPLLWHAEAARAAGVGGVELFYGARSDGDLVLLDDIERSRARLHLATEDGSRGIPGRVTAALEQRLADGARGTIMTCGPNAMMRAVVEIARRHGLQCFVSVEGEMACGIGACLGCAVPLVGEARPFGYACTDGPVFDAAKMVIP